MEGAAHADTTPQPTNTNVTTGESSDEHAIDIEVWYGDKASNIEKERTPCESRLPRIPKVPDTLRNSQNIRLLPWIQPSVVSIGPYYYNKNLRKAQKLKSVHAEKFIRESNQEKYDLYRKIKTKTPQLRKCYDNPQISEYDDNQLATMFLLDGCFLLHFINFSSKEDGFSNFDFTNHEIAYIKQDLFLLENQLPYEVLELLLKDAENSIPMKGKINDFVASHVPFPRGISVEEDNQQPCQPCHLLHYLQGVILNKPETSSPRQKQDKECKRRRIPKWPSCKNVQELRKVGIHFKPSPTSYLTDISFKSHSCTSGCLKLPIISMNTSTMIIFLNLVAFESSNTSETTTNNVGIISYLCFLDSLIDRWDDVKELQAAGILRNFAGEQIEVAQFFNNVCSKLVPNLSPYYDVIIQIDNHVKRHDNSRWRKGYIQFKQKYFSSPWSFIALIGAIIGLTLTGIQAYTSVFS
ncbi:hypothetical protein VitviT2T_012752 [Vitis vinifera]|uniref:Uncharacterized protein n=2 Tax=Vitis vinifera TaxID=29760 RepID=A0ABY9CH23_VITVI|nr:uncharacterized protein LOC104880132 [Vitis vinifera]XP_059595234.1 uncharacterized protein LOC104880132 [Vitis vinifera]WJZ93848.1 hypothetical protein VitviT2T_012752 [Vitis vinifera]